MKGSQKISIIGTGTVGCLNAIKFSNLGYEIDWYNDPTKPSLSIGEGTDLSFPKYLSAELNFNYDDLFQLGGHYKKGIEKIGWSEKPFNHNFSFGQMGVHMSARNFQNYVIDKLKNKVNLIEKSITHNDLNTYIIDCSGASPNISNKNITPIPLNNSYIAQCPWDKPRFDKTICIAKSYGWIFLIPLQNRCSVGYVYNSEYAYFEEIKNEMSLILKEYNLIANNFIDLPFTNYYNKINFKGEVAYNGNSSFFLEPMEATSISTSIKIINQTNNILNGGDKHTENINYKNYLEETIDIIMLHYLIDPPVKNLFWEYANHNAHMWFKKRFKEYPKISLITEESSVYYSTWGPNGFQQNIKGLNILDKLKQYQSG